MTALEFAGLAIAGAVFGIGLVTTYINLRAVYWLVRMNW